MQTVYLEEEEEEEKEKEDDHLYKDLRGQWEWNAGSFANGR